MANRKGKEATTYGGKNAVWGEWGMEGGWDGRRIASCFILFMLNAPHAMAVAEELVNIFAKTPVVPIEFLGFYTCNVHIAICTSLCISAP